MLVVGEYREREGKEAIGKETIETLRHRGATMSIKIGHIEMQGLTRSIGSSVGSGSGDRRRGQGGRGSSGGDCGTL